MASLKNQRCFFILPTLAIFIFFLTSCGVNEEASYQLPFVPVTFSIDTNGNISVHAAASVVTPIGTFSLGASAEAAIQPEDGSLLVIIKHQQNGSVVDSVYRLQTGQEEVTVVVNGTTVIQVANNKVTIDASAANVQSIEVTNATEALNTVATDTPTPTSTPSPTPSPTPTDTPTPSPIPPTPTTVPTQIQTVIYTAAPLSDGRVQAFMAFPHEPWIMSRWWVDMSGQWNSWQGSTYPSSTSGVIGLFSFIKDGITYLTVSLDDGTWWQYQKLSTDSNSGWTDFYRISTPTPVPPTQTHAVIYTNAPLSDGRVQAFMAFPHEPWIISRWTDSSGQWNSWQDSTYPSTTAGVIGLYGYIQQDITNLKVELDDGSCWQYQKLSTDSNSGWTDFYRC